ncbi:golgin subfamily A member 4 [Drosophila eugracilis]|uniref:golgin subfamily A member 4 n=1 Tax=Drosophila eugracilis TaxID=29029 RepID=UPI001BDB06E6|nr:golgin subfamily A member 4 [Drosophila eugracilis]
MTTTSLPRVPEGLRDLMKVYTKEVLREKPADLYGFSANFFNMIVGEKSNKMVRKYEPVQTYETIMKNRIRQQVPLSLVFNIIPETLTDLIKQFIKAVLREKPENIYIFAQEYFQRISKEKSGRIEYTKYSTYEKSLKGKENVTPVSKVTCECGRILSANKKDVENTTSAYTDTKLAEADQPKFSSRISYLQSVVIIQRHFRRYLKERKLALDKDKCNSVEYMTSILLIQRQVRRILAKKRVEKLKNSRDVRSKNNKFNTADYMKAVVVIQRHYRIYLKKKQEQNRLKNGTVSLATAAIIIQRAFRRMVARYRAKRTISSATDHAEELNDNASETGSYTSVSTALLSTESTELGMANYEERVHQKIIHEDEEVENNNVDAGLEKEYFAEPIKGQEKSIQLRKSEILSGALIESMIHKPDLKDLQNESKDLEVNALQSVDMEDYNDPNQAQEPEIIKEIKSSLDLESIPQVELKDTNGSEETELENEDKLQTELENEDKLKSNKASLDSAPEVLAEFKDNPYTENIEDTTKDQTKTESLTKDNVKKADGEFVESSLLHGEKKESDDGPENDTKKADASSDILQADEKDNEDKLPNETKSESQEIPIENEVTPTVSIEIEHVEDIPEESISTQEDTKDKNLTDDDSKSQDSQNITHAEDDSLKKVLLNQNQEVLEQETPLELLDENLETSADTPSQAENNKSNSLDKDENKSFEKTREKRSLEDEEPVKTNLKTQENIGIGNQGEMKAYNGHNLDGSLETIPILEDKPTTPPKTEDKTISDITETVEEIDESNQETTIEGTLDNVPEVDDQITESKQIASENINPIKDNLLNEEESLEPSTTATAQASELSTVEGLEVETSTEIQKETASNDELKADKEVAGLSSAPKTDQLESKSEKIREGKSNDDKKLPSDDLLKETEILQNDITELSQQETILIGQESLETEESSPAEDGKEKQNSKSSNPDFHNFDVLTENTELKIEDNVSSFKNPAEITEGPENQTEVREDIIPKPSELQQNTKTITENSVIEGKTLIKKSESLKSDEQESEKKVLSIELKQKENLKIDEESAEFGDKILPGESESSPVKDQQSNPEALPINSDSMQDEFKKLGDESTEVDVESTTKTESFPAEAEQLENETLPTQSESIQVQDSKVDGESAEDIKSTMESKTSRTESEQSDRESKPIESESMKVDKSELDSEFNRLKSTESAGADEPQQLDKETKLAEAESMQIEDDKSAEEMKSTMESKTSRTDSEKSDKEAKPIEFEPLQVDKSKLEGESDEIKVKSSTESESFQVEAEEVNKESLPEESKLIDETTELDIHSTKNSEDSLESVPSKASLERVTNSEEELGPAMSMGDTAIAVMGLSGKNKFETVNGELQDKPKSQDLEEIQSKVTSEKITEEPPNVADEEEIDGSETIINRSNESISEGNVEHPSSETALEKVMTDEGPIPTQLEGDGLSTKTDETADLKEHKDDSTAMGNTAAIIEDKKTEELNNIINSLVPLNPDVITAELQLKSFKNPNDDGAWYDIYVEPKGSTDTEVETTQPPVQTKKPNTSQVTSSVVEEPIIPAQRVPSYYTPKEIVENVEPKAKNSVSFFVSFNADDGKPKYKIPKKFQSKTDNREVKTNEAISPESDIDSNEEEIEVIEVSEGDPEYTQTGGSKLQTILELDNENDQPTENVNQSTDLEPAQKELSSRNINHVEYNLGKPKSNSEHYESLYKTDILNILRSVQIIERAYKRFKDKQSLKSEPESESEFEKQNRAAKIIQKWLRSNLKKKAIKVSPDDSRKSKENLAAQKIQRAYRRYLMKTEEQKIADEKLIRRQENAALIIQKAFRLFSQRKIIEPIKTQTSDDSKLAQNKAATKIQRAYRRYLKLMEKPEEIDSVKPQDPKIQDDGNQEEANLSVVNLAKVSKEPKVIDELKSEEIQEVKQPLISSSMPFHSPEPVDNLKTTKELKTDKLQDLVQVEENISTPIYLTNLSNEPKRIKELESEESQDIKNLSKVSPTSSFDESKPLTKLQSEKSDKFQELESVSLSSISDEPKPLAKLQSEDDFQEVHTANSNSDEQKSLTKLHELQKKEFQEQPKSVESSSSINHEKRETKYELQTDDPQSKANDPIKDEHVGKSSAALIIQRAFRQYMERKKLQNFDMSSFDSITSSQITAIENSSYPTATTPSESLVQEEPSEDASKIQPKSEWFVGSTRIIPSQGVVGGPLGVATDPDPDVITSKTSTQVESVEIVDRSHGSLESKLNPDSKIDEGSSEKDNAVSSGLAGLTEASEAGTGSVEDPLLLSQSDFGGIVQSLDIASTQELVNSFLENEIEYSSKQGPYPIASHLKEVIEEPCIKKCASLTNLSEGESEPEVAGQKAENTDSSISETMGLDTLSTDTIEKATVKLSKPEEVIEKMSQLRDSKSQERLSSADPSFDEPVVRPMSSLQEQSSIDIEDGDIIVYNRLQREETRESSAQSDSVVFGEAENIQVKDLLNEEESGRVHLMRHYTIAGDDPRGLFRSVTIDEGEDGMAINSAMSFCLDDETSENIRKKMMAYSLSETDSDYFDPKKSSKDFDIDTAMADDMGTSTETESTIVSAATKIQAGARGFLTRRRLRRASAGTKSSTLDTKASFGNDAISESLERFIEEEAAKKIQAAYRTHTRKRKGHPRKLEGISLESNLAARRQKLQRGDALRNDSTPDEENSVSTSGGQSQKISRTQRSKTVGETKSKADMELRWLKMRQNSMPVQIDCEVFRVIPKHMRKRIKSAEGNKRK